MSGTLGNGSYTRSFSGATSRDPTFPRFHMHPVEDNAASAAAGRPIFVQQERVQLIQPGSPNQPVFVVTDEHRQRWPEHYAAFRRGEESVADGTPLEQWPILNRGQVLEMKALGIHTVEQCAGLSDLAVQKIGMGGRKIRELATAYLDEAEQISITSKALDRAEKAEGRIAGLEAQNAEMRAMLDDLHSQLMAMKNAPNAIASYMPPQPPAPPAEPVGTSSLDALASRPRGRPRKEAA